MAASGRVPYDRPVDQRRRHGIASRAVRLVSADGAVGEEAPDELVVEEPLEIRVAGDPIAVTMRTPGDDADLALGFLFAEGIVGGTADVGRISHCGKPTDEGYGNTIDVLPGPGVALDPDRLKTSRRGTLTTAACGVCGRVTIDDLLDRVGAMPEGERIAVDTLQRCTDKLREEQVNFARTGGVHAAAVLSRAGEILALAEDVGRHNAVDKVVGALLRGDVLESARILVVSGRVSFEITQKAAVARIPVVAAVSAPTSLAVDVARRVGLTLCGFVRDGRLNVYAHPERLEGVD
jgi:FdhD protein